jgi:hypothetical protein
MKKRYKFKAASIGNPSSGLSSWIFFARMDELLRCSTIPQARPGVVCVDTGRQPALTNLGMQALPKVEIRDSEITVQEIQQKFRSWLLDHWIMSVLMRM